ncbi:hypothetical protein QZH41_004110 [Actinostola sp. cb2023]|nr:hypothetical protein QZH41_004110 [Actinostola sp. cb2023]
MMSTQLGIDDPPDDTDYEVHNRRVKETVAAEHELERYEDRTEDSPFSPGNWEAIHQGKFKTCWKGVILMKDPFTIVILQQLLWDIKPRTIIEFGANTGGSALYMADMMKMYGYNSHVYSMDINLELLAPLAREKRDDLTFIEGDCNKVEKAFPADFLKSLPHPWLVLEDAHVNTFGVLDYLDPVTAPGDYILVEDTNPVAPSNTNEITSGWGKQKLNSLTKFMKKHTERYRVDKRYTDFFG